MTYQTAAGETNVVPLKRQIIWRNAVGSDTALTQADGMLAKRIRVGYIPTAGMLILKDASGTVFPFDTDMILACDGILDGRWTDILASATVDSVAYTSNCYKLIVEW